MLRDALVARGNEVDTWAPKPFFYKILRGRRLAKWAGYVDQYLVFPLQVRKLLKLEPAHTLFVFCDQALGPWVPLVERRPHVVHAHDLLALRSALGHFPENPTALTGRIYQRYIRRGFQHARHFIAVSKNTMSDLQQFGHINAVTSDVVYNGLNYPYKAMLRAEAKSALRAAGLPASLEDMLLHVGGNQWYKNLAGVIAIYARYCVRLDTPLPLLCVSPPPVKSAQALLRDIPSNGKVYFVRDIDNLSLQAAYTLAKAFLFPSLAEGFGWPLIEAQACGCPVITTDEPPMNEVAGPSAIYLPRLRSDEDVNAWAEFGATQLTNVLNASVAEQSNRRTHGIAWARKFESNDAISQYLAIYEKIAASA